MLYLVGGVGRAGKSLLTERLLLQHRIAGFSLDVLRMGLSQGAPSLGLDPERNDLDEADLLWPIVLPMCRNLIGCGRDYCVEGACLRPQQAAEIIAASPGRVRACFLGYPHMDPATKASLIKRHTDGPNNWTATATDNEILAIAEFGISMSGLLRDSCQMLGLPFVDTGLDFEAGLLAAEESLLMPGIGDG